MISRSRICSITGILLSFGASGVAVFSAENAASIVVPEDRYALRQLVNAWSGLEVFILGMHENLGTPLASSGVYYVSPLLDSIDKQAARRRRAGTIIELRNLSTLGPDGGYLYSWVYHLPATKDLASSDIYICYEAVGIARGTGVIKPGGEFHSTPLPFGLDPEVESVDASCNAVVKNATR